MKAIAQRRELLEECRGKAKDVLKAMVRPEFLNRIDEIIMFEPLTQNDLREILQIQMNDLRGKLSEEGVDISFTDAFSDLMVEEGYDPAYGARPLKRLIQRDLVNLLAKEVLAGKVRRGDGIVADAAGGRVILRNVSDKK